jgi:hypothetical protein
MYRQVSGQNKRWSEFYRSEEEMNGRMRQSVEGEEEAEGENEIEEGMNEW